MNSKPTKAEREAARRAAYRQSRHDIRYDEQYGVGCLVTLGLMGLVPLVPVMTVIGYKNFRSLRDAIDWTDIATFFKSLWEWLRSGHGSINDGFVWVFGGLFCVLVWQWMAYMSGWPRLISGKRLWAVSSAYFFLMFGFSVYFGFRTVDTVGGGIFTVVVSIVFLTITLPLWLLTAPQNHDRTDAEPAARQEPECRQPGEG
jgi:hypothetical protein